ncbi:hypothetical protein [Flavobacterium sp. LC2016-01]|uniref:hypothetical protein n=1 Tax=Flavobacterium sp. LC2016-01 TaxID=2675876 RepID=UPI0012BA7F8C|nr:hypothetical protein [Flavobacterium sp. LC2016-01]MTH16579.1 hypothetical protein [Flavobacterium sp. LC2016-01]
MKKSIYIVCSILGIIITCNSQNTISKNQKLKSPEMTIALVDFWASDNLIGTDEESEYNLYKAEAISYGNYIKLNADNTFESGKSAPCALDCFRRNTGKYKMQDKNHIRFFLEKVETAGDCDPNLNPNPNQDKGLFFIYKDTVSIKFIKSDGKIKNDLQNVKYSALIDSLDRNNGVPNLHYLKWRPTNKTGMKEMLSDFFPDHPELKLSKPKVLYAKKIRSSFTVILFMQNKKYDYLVYDHFHKNFAIYEDPKEYAGVNYTDGKVLDPSDPDYIYDSQAVEVKPEYPGGIDKLYSFLNKNYIVPTELVGSETSRIYATFVIEKNGSLSNLRIPRNPGYGSSTAFAKVLKLLPKWNPAELNGRKVRCRYSISFSPST